jgi:hypothetical protein
MVFKLGKEAEKHWRKLRGYRKLAEVIQGVDFINGYTEKEWEKRKQESEAA